MGVYPLFEPISPHDPPNKETPNEDVRPFLGNEIPYAEQLRHAVELRPQGVEHLPEDGNLGDCSFLRRRDDNDDEMNQGEREHRRDGTHHFFRDGGIGGGDHEKPQKLGGKGVERDARLNDVVGRQI